MEEDKERRKDYNKLIELSIEQAKSNTSAIEVLKDIVLNIERKLDSHIKDEAPMMGLMEDVAAVGRAGRWFKAVLLWFAIVGGIIYGAYEWAVHLGKG